MNTQTMMRILLVGYLLGFTLVSAVPQSQPNFQSYHLNVAGGPSYKVSSSNSGFNIESAGGTRGISSQSASHSSASSSALQTAAGHGTHSASASGQLTPFVFGAQTGSNFKTQTYQDAAYIPAETYDLQSGNSGARSTFAGKSAAFNSQLSAVQLSGQNIGSQKSFSYNSGDGHFDAAHNGASSLNIHSPISSASSSHDSSIVGNSNIISQPLNSQLDSIHANPGVSSYSSELKASHLGVSKQNVEGIQRSSAFHNEAASKFITPSSGLSGQTGIYGGYNTGRQSSLNRAGSSKSSFGYEQVGIGHETASGTGSSAVRSQNLNAGQTSFGLNSGNTLSSKSSNVQYGQVGRSSGLYGSEISTPNSASQIGPVVAHSTHSASALRGPSAIQKSSFSGIGSQYDIDIKSSAGYGATSVGSNVANSRHSVSSQTASSSDIGNKYKGETYLSGTPENQFSGAQKFTGSGFSAPSDYGGQSKSFGAHLGSEINGQLTATQQSGLAQTDRHSSFASRSGPSFGLNSAGFVSNSAQKSALSGFGAQPSYASQSGARSGSIVSGQGVAQTSSNSALFGTQPSFGNQKALSSPSSTLYGSFGSSSSSAQNAALVGTQANYGTQSGSTFGSHSGSVGASQVASAQQSSSSIGAQSSSSQLSNLASVGSSQGVSSQQSSSNFGTQSSSNHVSNLGSVGNSHVASTQYPSSGFVSQTSPGHVSNLGSIGTSHNSNSQQSSSNFATQSSSSQESNSGSVGNSHVASTQYPSSSFVSQTSPGHVSNLGSVGTGHVSNSQQSSSNFATQSSSSQELNSGSVGNSHVASTQYPSSGFVSQTSPGHVSNLGSIGTSHNSNSQQSSSNFGTQTSSGHLSNFGTRAVSNVGARTVDSLSSYRSAPQSYYGAHNRLKFDSHSESSINGLAENPQRLPTPGQALGFTQRSASGSGFRDNSGFGANSASYIGSYSSASQKSTPSSYGVHSVGLVGSQSASTRQTAASSFGKQSGLEAQSVSGSSSAESSTGYSSANEKSGLISVSQSDSSFRSNLAGAISNKNGASQHSVSRSGDQLHYGVLSDSTFQKQSENAVGVNSAVGEHHSHSGVRSGSSVHNLGDTTFQNAFIVRQVQEQSDDGSKFLYSYDTDNGISVQGSGLIKNIGTEAESQEVTGSYSYVGPDGITYTVNYIANERGFQPEGQHIPQIPEEIARSIEYNLAHPEEEKQVVTAHHL